MPEVPNNITDKCQHVTKDECEDMEPKPLRLIEANDAVTTLRNFISSFN